MKFIELALEAGFTKEQAEFMEEHLAKYPHGHSMDEIEGLDESLEAAIGEIDEEDEEEEEDED